MIAAPIHCFEKAGLGLAPFRCVGLHSLPSPSLAEHNPTAYNNALAALPRGLGLGSCHYCGTALMHNFVIASADDKRFVVGCDCVARTGDAGLILAVKRVRVADKLEKRNAARGLKRAEREALWAAERAQRAELFRVEHAALIKRAARFYDLGGFIKDVTERGILGGFMSDRALAALEKAVAGMELVEHQRANSKHVGEVGQRLPFEVTVQRVNYFDRPCFQAPWRQECVWVVSMVDAQGNVLVSKTPTFKADVGETFKMKATIKAHDEYKGLRQTIVNRVTRNRS